MEKAVTEATSTFQDFLRLKLANTEWASIKVFKTKTKVANGKTVAIQTIARVPESKMIDILKPSGINEKQIFTREFVDPAKERSYQYTNLWLADDKYTEAKVKHATLPEQKAFGLVWSTRGFGIRVKTAEASDISPMLTGQKYVVGDRFIISGIPQDVFPPQLFKALEECDVPWLGVSGSHRISTRYRGGSYSWIIKCPTQPPTSLFFLDEAVITVHKEEFKIKKDTMDHQPKVSVSAWTRVAQCPKPNSEHAPNAKRMREEGNEQQAMNVEEVTATANMNTQVNEGRHVQGGAAAPINMPEDERLQKRMKAKDKEEINQLKAEVASLTDLVQQLLQRLDSMAGSEMPSPFPTLR